MCGQLSEVSVAFGLIVTVSANGIGVVNTECSACWTCWLWIGDIPFSLVPNRCIRSRDWTVDWGVRAGAQASRL